MADNYKKQVEPRLARISKMVLAGCTNDEIIKLLDISESSFYEYKNKYREFSDVLRRDREEQTAEVEHKYFESCIGYQYQEEIVLNQKEIIYSDDGKKIKEITKPHKVKVKKYRPPDTSASKWWLINRNPKDWKETSKIELSGNPEQPVVFDLSKYTLEELKDIVRIKNDKQ